MRKARRQAHMIWAVGVVAPWCLAAGALVSFTADAGQEVPSGASSALQTSTAAVMPQKLVPSPRALTTSFGDAFGRGMLHEARLVLGAPEQLAGRPDDEVQPRAVLKHNTKIFPEIDRSHRGDPFIGLRPSIEGNLLHKGGLAKLRGEALTFGHDEFEQEGGPVSSFSALDGDAPGPDSVANFEAWPEGESPVTLTGPGTSVVISPKDSGGPLSEPQMGETQTPRPASHMERAGQGATPAAPRAVALNSTTPFDSDQTPAEAFAALAPHDSETGVTAIPRRDDRTNYLALIPAEKLDSEKHCLAQAIYFEARSEPLAGQAAVAQVILNRMTSGLYPSTICGVVFQNRRHRHACQFSFACDGHALRVHEAEAWTLATRVADDVLDGKTWVADVGGATHYHANYVRPRWARALTKTDVIGNHVFYRLKPGQT